MNRPKRGPALSTDSPLFLVVLDEKNTRPGRSGSYVLRNFGGPPPLGSLYLDANPGELHMRIQFIYQQVSDARLIRGTPPTADYEASFKGMLLPSPRSLHDVIAKMNEGQFLQLGPTDKGVCTVPKSRRSIVLGFLGLSVR